MLQVNIQSLLLGTRSELGHQWKNVKHEILYREHLYLIEEGYKKLSKTTNVSLMSACPYTQNAKKSYYPPLKHSAIYETPSKPLFQEGDRKENITNKINIFTGKPIKC